MFDFQTADLPKLNASFLNIDKIVMSSSFGVTSVVMLHMVSTQMPGIPIVVVDTGYLFPETYQFIETLRKRLHLNIVIYKSGISPELMEKLHGELWSTDLAFYHTLRKTEPMERALSELGATVWITGRHNGSSSSRSLDVVQRRDDGRYKVNPIARWGDFQINHYLGHHGLPTHPLFPKYGSVGDWHSTLPGEGRSGRFKGTDRKVCLLHTEEGDGPSI